MSRKMIGQITSTKMEQTAVVSVITTKQHPLYRKKYHATAKFLAHNPENRFAEGDTVEISETRPLSKRKRWEIARKIEVQKGAK